MHCWALGELLVQVASWLGRFLLQIESCAPCPPQVGRYKVMINSAALKDRTGSSAPAIDFEPSQLQSGDVLSLSALLSSASPPLANSRRSRLFSNSTPQKATPAKKNAAAKKPAATMKATPQKAIAKKDAAAQKAFHKKKAASN